MACWSPLSHRSKRELGVTRVFSNSAMASVTSSSVISSFLYTALNDSRYCGIERSTSMARMWVKAISFGLEIGPAACSLRSAARPSQNCARFRLELSTVGELIGPCCQLWPMELGRLSLPPMDRLWQELHEMNPERDRRGSKNNCLPNSTLAGSVISAGAMNCTGSLSGTAAQALAPRHKPAIRLSVRMCYLLRYWLFWLCADHAQRPPGAA